SSRPASVHPLPLKEEGNPMDVARAACSGTEPKDPLSLPAPRQAGKGWPQAARGVQGQRWGEGQSSDLRELVIELAAHLLVQTKRAANLEAARAQADACLNSSAPLRKWEEMLAAQGADLQAYQRRLSRAQ